MKHFPQQAGKRILAASGYYTPQRVLDEFGAAMGKPARAQHVPPAAFKALLPAAMAEEMLENTLLLEDPGYYGGADLAASLALLDGRPTAWKDYVQANRAMWE